MTTVYPGALDTFTNPDGTDAQDSPSHADQHANANDALEAIEAELGTNPSGSFASVTERMAAMVAKVDNGTWVLDNDTDTWVNIRIPENGTPNASREDKLSFWQETANGSGTYWQTGYHNEKGELRARPAGASSCAFRAFSYLSGTGHDTFYFFQLARGDTEAQLIGVNEKGMDSSIPVRAPNLWRDVRFGVSGALTTRTGTTRWYNDTGVTLTIQKVTIEVSGAAPAGAAILVDVNKNGTTIYSTQGNRPTIAAGASIPLRNVATAPNVTTLADGDYLTVDIDQVGSTPGSPGSDLLVTIWVV